MQRFSTLLTSSPIGFLEGRFRTNYHPSILENIENLEEKSLIDIDEDGDYLKVLFEKDGEPIGKLTIQLTKENCHNSLLSSDGPESQFGSLTLSNSKVIFPNADFLPECYIELMYDHTPDTGRFIASIKNFKL